MERTEPVRFRFGTFELDLRNSRLLENGGPTPLQAKPFTLLAELVRRSGQVATRAELATLLWPNTFVQVDQGLNAAIRKIRQTLHDDVKSPVYLETLGSKGYRFVHAVDVVEWEDFTAPTPQSSPRLAVLPMTEVSDTSPTGLGLNGEVAARLGKLCPEMSLVAPGEIFCRRSNGDIVSLVAREFQVQFVLTGRVRRMRDRVHLTPMLLETQGQSCLWSGTYEYSASELGELAEDIARRVSSRLRTRIPHNRRPIEIASRTPTKGEREGCLRGQFHLKKHTPAALWKALQSFEAAAEADPRYAAAHAGIAGTMNLLALYGLMVPREAYLCAKQEALRALDLAPDMAEAMIPLAWATLMLDYDWRMARSLLQRALASEPGNAHAYHALAGVELAAGRFSQAHALLQAALHVDPIAPLPNLTLALLLHFEHDHEGAIRQAEMVLELEPENSLALAAAGRALLELGQHEKALHHFGRAMTLAPEVAAFRALMAFGLARAGEVGAARASLFQLEASAGEISLPSYLLGMAYGALGESERATKWFLRAEQERSPWAMYLAFDPAVEVASAHPLLPGWQDALRDASLQSPSLRLAMNERARNLG